MTRRNPRRASDLKDRILQQLNVDLQFYLKFQKLYQKRVDDLNRERTVLGAHPYEDPFVNELQGLATDLRRLIDELERTKI